MVPRTQKGPQGLSFAPITEPSHKTEDKGAHCCDNAGQPPGGREEPGQFREGSGAKRSQRGGTCGLPNHSSAAPKMATASWLHPLEATPTQCAPSCLTPFPSWVLSWPFTTPFQASVPTLPGGDYFRPSASSSLAHPQAVALEAAALGPPHLPGSRHPSEE